MELKVWVEGIQRIVCGVTDATTCQDVVFALAHATGKTGRFTLMEKWRNNERLLAPTDTPLKILMKWGEYSSDVQFILQRSDQQQQQPPPIQQPPPTGGTVTLAAAPIQSQQQIARQQMKRLKENNNTIQESSNGGPSTIDDKKKELAKKGLNLTGFCDNKEVGIVKGVPQINQLKCPTSPPQKARQPIVATVVHHDRIPSQTSSTNDETTAYVSLNTSGGQHPDYAYVTKKRPMHVRSPSSNDATNNIVNTEFNSADIRNSLDRKINLSSDNLVDVYLNNSRNTVESSNTSSCGSDVIKSPVGISANGALCPPPYRDPPPPRHSPLTQQHNSNAINNNINTNTINDTINDVLLNNAHYKDLIQLIKYQRDKISLQQADLTKFDAEIVYLEGKERDQLEQIEAITREITKTDQIYRQGAEQLQSLRYIEEENEIVRQQENTLKSEITLLRSKLANCETELLQCKNKIRLLMDEIQLEQRVLNRHYDNRQQLERHFLTEVEKIQTEIDQAIQSADSTNKTSDNLKREVAVIENMIAEKKKQVEQLVNEMKEVNLKSLSASAPSEEIKHFLEGSNRPGSSRKMVGSPRQLENAVPTSKNPHGVWV